MDKKKIDHLRKMCDSNYDRIHLAIYGPNSFEMHVDGGVSLDWYHEESGIIAARWDWGYARFRIQDVQELNPTSWNIWVIVVHLPGCAR